MVSRSKKFILWFDELSIDDVPLVGGKNASLGEMYRELSKQGVSVPNGFAVTATAYRYLLDKAGIKNEIKTVLKTLNVKNMHNLSEHGKKVREIIRNAKFPDNLRKEIVAAYHQLSESYKTDNVDVAVRSSATAEDLPGASFAGQQETFLNICGDEQLIDACKDCFASLFTNRAIVYREEKGFDHFKVALSIGVQKMVRSDRACSGVMFTLDTESGFKDVVFVTGSWGLGENIVQGAVNPDEFFVFKPTLKKGFNPIISKKIGEKAIKRIYAEDGGLRTTKDVVVEKADRERFCLDGKEILQLAKWGCVIEDHYSKKHKYWCPMDIEWAKDGETKQLFIVQARPETVQSQKNVNVLEEYILQQKGKVLTTGKSVGEKIGQGVANVIKDVKDIAQFKDGQVLITEMTDPDWVPVMKMASAIVTNKGGRTCHAAIISRELGIPCVVGTNNATEVIKNNQKITVSCAEGEQGKVYDGLLKFRVKKTNLKLLKKPKTKVMMNVGNPDEAFSLSFLPNDGVGLAREEFIITSYIKAHPLALLNFKKMPPAVKKEIEDLTKGYKDKTEFFVYKLALGVSTSG
ncbi:phosphoenolpyruvate synthase, partial [Candidatus Woesearchaeota archaeon]|nr:phosphoenolpyruvate synthase [Candidatus Woesearchaeota archaeon]